MRTLVPVGGSRSLKVREKPKSGSVTGILFRGECRCHGGGRMTNNEWKRQQQLDLAVRLREIRQDLCGESGGQLLADALKLPLQSWLKYESGAVVPAKVVLQLIVTASINHDWLLTGQGEKYSRRSQQNEAGSAES
jgi:hypothetical protein